MCFPEELPTIIQPGVTFSRFSPSYRFMSVCNSFFSCFSVLCRNSQFPSSLLYCLWVKWKKTLLLRFFGQYQDFLIYLFIGVAELLASKMWDICNLYSLSNSSLICGKKKKKKAPILPSPTHITMLGKWESSNFSLD